MATLQVRDIDDKLYETLKRMAARDHRSLSQEVVKMLEDGVGMPPTSQQSATASFLSLCGTWDDPRSADEIVRDLKRARKNSARFRSGDGVSD